MRGEVQELNFNGNILIAGGENIIYQNAFGLRNFETREVLNNNSVFYLASVSKKFTAMAILMLEKEGKISLSDSLRKFFPRLPYFNFTIQQKLTHTSGFPKYEAELPKNWDHHKVATNKEVIAFLEKEKPGIRFEPGVKWEYSNTGYLLLSSVIEQVSGQFKQAN